VTSSLRAALLLALPPLEPGTGTRAVLDGLEGVYLGEDRSLDFFFAEDLGMFEYCEERWVDRALDTDLGEAKVDVITGVVVVVVEGW